MKKRIVDQFALKPRRRETDEIWDHYADVLIGTFSEHILDSTFFEEVYTTQRIRKFDEKFLDSIIFNVPPAFLEGRHLFARHRDKEAYSEIKKMLTKWGAGRGVPLFILGYVGTGKTTFLHYAFALKNKLRSDCKIAAAIVDLKVAPSTSPQMYMYMLKQINKEINESYPKIATIDRSTLNKLFEDEVSALEKSLRNKGKLQDAIDELYKPFPVCEMRGDKDNLQLLINKKIVYLKKNGIIDQFWTILDNIDQHHYCLHQRVLVESMSIVEGIGSNLIISMRYITLNSPEAREVYSTYNPRKLNLSLPDIGSLLRKRYNILIRELEPFKDKKLSLTGYQYTVSKLAKDLETVLELLVESEFMNNWLIPLSNYNIRRLLQIIINSFQSYYLFFDYFNNDRYLPNQEMLMKRMLFSHCLKNQEYFDPASDEEEVFIINLFENENQASGYNQTIRIRLLQALRSFGKTIELGEYTRLLMETFNYKTVDILRAIRIFLKANLFAVKSVISEDFTEAVFLEGLQEESLYDNNVHISITFSGILHLELLYIIEYVEIMKFSTYVNDTDYEIIQSKKAQKVFKTRIQGLKKFVQYLANEEMLEQKYVVKNKENFNNYFGLFSDQLRIQTNNQIKALTDQKIIKT